jgi:hypothetical protein
MLSPTVPNELNYALPWVIMDQIQKASRYSLSKQEGAVEAKKLTHATVPLNMANNCRVVTACISSLVLTRASRRYLLCTSSLLVAISAAR